MYQLYGQFTSNIALHSFLRDTNNCIVSLRGRVFLKKLRILRLKRRPSVSISCSGRHLISLIHFINSKTELVSQSKFCNEYHLSQLIFGASTRHVLKLRSSQRDVHTHTHTHTHTLTDTCAHR